jgi:NAD(P)-dependent dehydrogenase (short-subunit alcohol dehydrogenase family)
MPTGAPCAENAALQDNAGATGAVRRTSDNAHRSTHPPRNTPMKLSSDVSAIVTGGASGLGAATAQRLAAQGVKVALFDLNEAAGEPLAKQIGGVFCKVDVTNEEQVDAAFAKARAAIGQERILVNCAGTGNAVKTASRDKTTGEIKAFPTVNFDRIIQINLVGTFRCIAKSAAGMMTLPVLEDSYGSKERGAIVNTASVAAQDGQIGQASYSASKAAIVGMTLPIARDLMGEGIRVNTILPGIFKTPLLAGLPDNVKDALAASVPFPKRLGEPDEYAQLAEFMITCGYMNGESVRCDGAIRMAPR